jgi:hypothetical protein
MGLFAAGMIQPGVDTVEIDASAEDIIDEAISLFRANCFFRNYEIQGNGDRVLIYLILFVSECLNKVYPIWCMPSANLD